MRKFADEKSSHGCGYFSRAFAIVCVMSLILTPNLYPQGTSPSLPTPTSPSAPSGMDLRWHDPGSRNQAVRQKRIEFGQKQRDINSSLGISDCEREVCFLSLPLQPGWYADFGPELAGISPVTVHFSEEGLYLIETSFPTSFFDYLEPQLVDRYGATTFRNSSAERDQEVREWQVDGVRVRLVKRWYHGNREEGSLSLRREKESPQPSSKRKLPF